MIDKGEEKCVFDV
jgi:hypothetical protein